MRALAALRESRRRLLRQGAGQLRGRRRAGQPAETPGRRARSDGAGGGLLADFRLGAVMVETLTRKGFVYAFGGGGADGDASMKDLLGGKGANLAEMSALGLPVPPGFTITTEACSHFYANERRYPESLKGEVAEALCARRDADRQAVRRRGQSAAGLGPLRRARLDARHDGHRAEPRPQRRDRRGPGQARRRPPVRFRQLPPLHPDVLERGAGPRPPHVRGDPRRP